MTTRLTLLRYARRHPRELRAVLGWAAVAAVPTAAVGRLVAVAVDAAVSAETLRLLIALGAIAAGGVIGVFATLRSTRAAATLNASIRHDLTHDVIAGNLAAAVTEDQPGRAGAEFTVHIDVVADIARQLLGTLPVAAGVVGATVGVATLRPVLVAVIGPLVVAAALAEVVAVQVSVRRSRRAAAAREEVQVGVATALAGVRDLTAANAVPETVDRLSEQMDAARRHGVRATDATALGQAMATGLAVYVPVGLVVLWLPTLLERGDLSVGGAIGAVTYLLAGLAYAVNFATTLTEAVVELRVHLGRLATSVRPPPAGPTHGGLPGSIELHGRSLSFAYGASARPIVAGLDLLIPPGDHLAIVGPSGVGKSTLAGLLSGTLTPTEGEVSVGDEPLIDHRLRPDLVAVIPQESYVFVGTLRENLTYLNPGAPAAEIEDAARLVGLERVLDRLGGLDAAVDTTMGGLSEGERQLITLTRVYLTPTPIVILDEATCYLDPVAEEQAERAFMATGRTLIVIAHRMSAALRAKRVLVMDGNTTQVGTHEDLLSTNPLYADLHGYWQAAS